jgi:hypothetical protein
MTLYEWKWEYRDGNNNKAVTTWYFSSVEQIRQGYLNNATHFKKIESTKREVTNVSNKRT